MEPYANNAQCILDYLALFQALAGPEAEAVPCLERRRAILLREQSSGSVRLAPPLLRRQFQLEERDFLLAMAALALEMDGGLRNTFRRTYGLNLPTIEYGLQLISPVCPCSCETLAELAGRSRLCGLLLTTAEAAAYPMERPLILCRTALAFLTGLSMADIPACTLLPQGDNWLPLYPEELEQVRMWRSGGAERTLYLCAPAGSGRKTLLRRACGQVVCVAPGALADLSLLDRDHALREAAAMAVLLDAPVCARPDPQKKVFPALERLCRQYAVPLAALVEEDGALENAGEVIRLPRRLSPAQRQMVWQFFLPQAEPGSLPGGAMTIGAVQETARLSLRCSSGGPQENVAAEDIRRAMLQRSGALEFGVRYQTDTTLEDMVLPRRVQEQLELMIQAALCADRLPGWGLPCRNAGVTAVFHGPSGTGKTMAASAIAHRLGMPLLRADLSQIMDKYVGETEKHLGRLLQSAEENHCVLLFDEADSLFGKRAQVSTGHDKYANLSTSYLLQEIERYDGVVILSTNLLGNFDDAFLRRLQYIVRFSLPDAALRESFWRKLLPAERCSSPLPYAALAQAELSPARILAAVRGAAVAAISAGRETAALEEIVNSLRLELEKENKSLPRALAGTGETEAAHVKCPSAGSGICRSGGEGPQPDRHSHPDEAGF